MAVKATTSALCSPIVPRQRHRTSCRIWDCDGRKAKGKEMTREENGKMNIFRGWFLNSREWIVKLKSLGNFGLHNCFNFLQTFKEKKCCLKNVQYLVKFATFWGLLKHLGVNVDFKCWLSFSVFMLNFNFRALQAPQNSCSLFSQEISLSSHPPPPLCPRYPPPCKDSHPCV